MKKGMKVFMQNNRMSDKLYDILVVGLGPAGANFCANISSAFSVLAVDSRKFENGVFITKKCCGGLLNEDCKTALSEESLSIPKDVLMYPQSFVVKTFDFDNKLSKTYRKSYLNIDRDAFDAFLVGRISEDVELSFQTIFSGFEDKGDYYEVALRTAQGNRLVRAKRIVDASGAISVIRRRCFSKKVLPERYSAVQRWYRSSDLPDYMLAVFDKRITDYYGWGIAKDDSYLLGLASNYKGSIGIGFDIMLNDLKHFGLTFPEEYRTEGSVILRPRNNSEINLNFSRISFIGEAAGLISTSSSEGISYAIRSGRYLADAFNRDVLNYQKIYEKKAKKLRHMLLIRRLKAPVMYEMAGLPRGMIMKSGIISID